MMFSTRTAALISFLYLVTFVQNTAGQATDVASQFEVASIRPSAPGGRHGQERRPTQ